MTSLIKLSRMIFIKHADPLTKIPEFICLGYCDAEAASEHLSRYLLASKFVHGVVLDVACGTCYGSSILKRRVGVEMVVSVDIDRDAIKYGRMIYGVECVRADAAHLPFRKNAFDSVISLETLEHVRDQGLFLGALGTALKRRES